ncbi:hypothetical protein EUA78_00380 [TM7 phylum sp. oral taxon 351]|nr:hypothetical protein EUA78_00380 [TM7 phylum sp. oral taxon 351]
MSKMIDALKVMAGKDLDENKAPGVKKPERKFFSKIDQEQPEIVAAADPEAQKLEATSAESKKAEKSEKVETESAKDTDSELKVARLEASDRSAFVDLVAYSNSDDMKSDLIAFFKGGDPSEMLVKLTDAVNGVTSLSAPAPVKSDSDKTKNEKESVGSESYKLEYRFLDAKTGATRMAQAEALLKSGVALDDIENYNLLLKVFRINPRTDELIDEGDDEDYKKVKAFLKTKN